MWIIRWKSWLTSIYSPSSRALTRIPDEVKTLSLSTLASLTLVKVFIISKSPKSVSNTPTEVIAKERPSMANSLSGSPKIAPMVFMVPSSRPSAVSNPPRFMSTLAMLPLPAEKAMLPNTLPIISVILLPEAKAVVSVSPSAGKSTALASKPGMSAVIATYLGIAISAKAARPPTPSAYLSISRVARAPKALRI